jgi:DNA ligase 1
VTPLAEVVHTSARVAATSSRLGKIGAIAQCLRRVAPGEIAIAIAYLGGETRQAKLGMGYGALMAAKGAGSAHPRLTLAEVDRALEEIGASQGKGAAARRAARLGALFAAASPEEQDFLVRLLAGALRQGALEGVMAEAIAAAAAVPVVEVRRAAMLAGGLGAVAHAALVEGAAGLGRFAVRTMRPLLPMLAQSVEDTDEALAALGTAALEWKIDGARVQVHKSGDEVRVFTRRLNEVTAAVPEIVALVRAVPARALILDGEAIALRPDGKPCPFQVTMRRFGRKLDVQASQRQLPLSAFFFDCLLHDGEALIDRPARERLRALEEALAPQYIVPRRVTSDPAQARAFYCEARRHGHEGLMAKALEARYEAGRRGAGWLKVKQAHTLDLVVLAAEWGNGRRRGRLSNLHLGARDAQRGGFVMLGKTFKGLTDAMLEWQTRELLARAIGRDESVVHVRPELVVEIAFNELQESPQYPGGLALRFARVRGYRPDKGIEQADTFETVRRLYAAQGRR